MSSQINKKGIKAAILTISFVQLGTNGVAAILADIAREFPHVSTTTIQLLMTFPSLFIVGLTLISAWLSNFVSKKILVYLGLVLVSVSGILSFLFHDNLISLFLWAGILGIGIGLVVPMAFSFISDYFDEEEQSVMMGLQSSASNIGSMVMTLVGGFLASISWNYDYLVYLLAIPGLLLTCIYVPRNQIKKIKSSNKKVIPKNVWLYGLIAFMFMLVFYMGPTNLSLFVAEEGIGSNALAGMAATIFLLGGALMGILFGFVSSKIGLKTIPIGFFILAIGFIIMSKANYASVFYLGSFLAGSSISLTLPQCMLRVSLLDNKEEVTLGLAIVMACGNLGTFAAPMLTNVAAIAMKSDLAKNRFVFCGEVAVILAIILYILCKLEKKRSID